MINLNRLEPILSKGEIEVIVKRLNNEHITQTESNYLSRSIRPKLKSAEFAVSNELLSLLDYRRKKYEREDRILKEKVITATGDLSNIKAILVYGSYVRNNHAKYRDIDVMVVLGKKVWKSSAEKSKLEADIQKKADIKIDVSLISYSGLRKLFPYSPLIRTELEDYKLIYGDIKLREKIIINKPYLYRKLLEVEYALEIKDIEPKYIYNALRSCISIELFLKKKIDNKLIIRTIEGNIGKFTAESLINNKANSVNKAIALKYLRYLYNKLSKELE